ncbi:hypothetical protein Btru_046803 [Bulinus truncatus]|nr:hypothetical protein Btru_046803 [Bulinus truncatus]
MNLRRKDRPLDRLLPTPGQRIRQENKACQKRLFVHMDALNRRCQLIMARLSRDIDTTRRKLRETQVDVSTPPTRFPELKITTSRKTKKIIGEDLHPPADDHKFRPEVLPAIDSKHSTESESQKGVYKPCRYGTLCQSCRYFPCQRPRTYHSLGFRPDNCSTYKWVTWTDLQKAISPDVNGLDEIEARKLPHADRGLRLKLFRIPHHSDVWVARAIGNYVPLAKSVG